MPAGMIITSDLSDHIITGSSCRESVANILAPWIAKNEVSWIETKIRASHLEHISLLENLLHELERYIPGVTASVSIAKSDFGSDRAVVHLDWEIADNVMFFWWWATLLQRIVVRTEDVSQFVDIAAALRLSNKWNDTMHDMVDDYVRANAVWEYVVNGIFTCEYFKKRKYPGAGPCTVWGRR